jgi:RimJ/RimL family protein N-acetyltransferase
MTALQPLYTPDRDTVLDLGPCQLRRWREGDQPSLLRHANDAEVARWLRDGFPHPYTAADADSWIEHAGVALAGKAFAIDVGGEAVGAVGLMPGDDIFARAAEVGYWLGRAYWGRGLAPLSLTALSRYATEQLGFLRLYAGVFAGNERSVRVLQKAGYQLESVRQAAIVKHGTVYDEATWVVLAQSHPAVQGRKRWSSKEFHVG